VLFVCFGVCFVCLCFVGFCDCCGCLLNSVFVCFC